MTKEIHITGTPNEKQKQFFASKARFTAYGGARGGGKSWALRRKLVAMCLRYDGIRCLLIRRTLPELKSNHVAPFLREYGEFMSYHESDKCLSFPNSSKIYLGYCSCDSDAQIYQGQEYDVIAIDEATQMNEYRFSIFKACLRGVGDYPRRMYLTCNPGGIGHSWVKRLFVDRDFRSNEDPDYYKFIPALVFDNEILTSADPDYVRSLETLPERLRDAWLYGRWDVCEGQFFPEFDSSVHVCKPADIPSQLKYFAALDYGFDMLAVLLLGIDFDKKIYVLKEYLSPGLTLSEAAHRTAELCRGYPIEYLVASPDLWNRRQDTGRSGFEIMQEVYGVPPMICADNRRIPGWRVVREYLSHKDSPPKLKICCLCGELIHSLPALLCDTARVEDASGEPHAITHAPEALRYALMSRINAPDEPKKNDFEFTIPRKTRSYNY